MNYSRGKHLVFLANTLKGGNTSKSRVDVLVTSQQNKNKEGGSFVPITESCTLGPTSEVEGHDSNVIPELCGTSLAFDSQLPSPKNGE